MASPKAVAAPRPEVLHIPTILRRVESGDIRVPDFQRTFVWKEKQVIELLESVYKGYPIGSLLFWQAKNSQLKYDAARSYPLPNVEKAREPVNFLLDGQQRLTTLYGCLYLPRDRWQKPGVFNVVFDLRLRQFRHWCEDDERATGLLCLAELFSPEAFLEAQRRLQAQSDTAALLAESVKLHSVFQEYMVPTVTIEKRAVNEVVEIFERINRTGTKLSAVDFMRAVTWSGGFDLGKAVARLEHVARRRGFEIRQETLVKMVAVMLDTQPVPEAMLEMRYLSAAKLTEGVTKAEAALRRTLRFLRARLHVHSDVFVPYEGQYLVLARMFRADERLSEMVAGIAAKWFLTVSVNEGLRGKPDHVVADLVDRAGKLADGRESVLPLGAKTGADDMQRRLIRGKALSMGVLNVMALAGPRSVVSGEPIAPAEFMTEFLPDRFVPIVAPKELSKGGEGGVRLARILANVAIAAAADVHRLSKRPILAQLQRLKSKDEPLFGSVLESQLISPKAFHRLEAGDVEGFLGLRAERLLQRIGEACG